MLTLPPPRVEKGGDGYMTAFHRLKDLDLQTPLNAPKNQEVFASTLKIVEGSLGAGMGDDDKCQLQSLKALLHFQRNEYPQAQAAATDAIMSARALERRRTLPAFIYAVAALYEKSPDLGVILPQYLRYSFLAEPENKLIPAMCGIFLDRAMYRYNSGAWDCGHMGLFVDILCEPSIEDHSGVCLAILTTRVMIQIKREQQSIYANTGTVSETLRNDPNALAYLKARLQSYTNLLGLMRGRVIGELERRSKLLPKGSGVDPFTIRALVTQYENDLPKLQQAIGTFAHERQMKQVARGATFAVVGILAAGAVGFLTWRRLRRGSPQSVRVGT